MLQYLMFHCLFNVALFYALPLHIALVGVALVVIAKVIVALFNTALW